MLGVEAPSDDSPLVVHMACPEDGQQDCIRCGTWGGSSSGGWCLTDARPASAAGSTVCNYRIRVLLEAVGVDWGLLPRLTPPEIRTAGSACSG